MSLVIRRLDFNPWGCFSDHSLSFEAKPGQIDLVYGPNASGKSTTSRGERSLLYGIDARTTDGHTHPYPTYGSGRAWSWMARQSSSRAASVAGTHSALTESPLPKRCSRRRSED
jgi:hypothetical protein